MLRRIGLAFVAVAGMVVGIGCGGGNPAGPDPETQPTPPPSATLTAVRVEGSTSVAEGGRCSSRPWRASPTEFRATEWDEQVVVIPPSVRWVRDDRMNNRSGSHTHSYANGSWPSLGNNSITLGGSGCRARIDYSVSATRR